MPGMYAEATLTLERRNRVIAVPPEAVTAEGEKNTVWVVDGSGKVEPREVSAGLETPAYLEVISGLNEGDLVVVGDRSALKPGETVRPRQIQLLQYRGDQ